MKEEGLPGPKPLAFTEAQDWMFNLVISGTEAYKCLDIDLSMEDAILVDETTSKIEGVSTVLMKNKEFDNSVVYINGIQIHEDNNAKIGTTEISWTYYICSIYQKQHKSSRL